MSHHHVQRCQVSCHAEGEARRRWSRRRRRHRRHRGPGNHGDDDIGRWNLLGHHRVWGVDNSEIPKTNISKYLLVAFCLVFFCGIYRRIEENVSLYLGFEYHQKETLSLSQDFKTLRSGISNIKELRCPWCCESVVCHLCSLPLWLVESISWTF